MLSVAGTKSKAKGELLPPFSCCMIYVARRLPINNVWIALLSPPRAREALTYAAFNEAFLAFFNLCFSRRNVSNMHSGSLIQPASYMYRFTPSGNCLPHPVRLILYLATVQLQWSSWGDVFLVQGHQQ